MFRGTFITHWFKMIKWNSRNHVGLVSIGNVSPSTREKPVFSLKTSHFKILWIIRLMPTWDQHSKETNMDMVTSLLAASIHGVYSYLPS